MSLALTAFTARLGPILADVHTPSPPFIRKLGRPITSQGQARAAKDARPVPTIAATPPLKAETLPCLAKRKGDQ